MASKRVDYSLSGKAIKYFLFSKKRCPNCNHHKMTRIVKKDYIGKGKGIRRYSFGDKIDTYNGTIYYKCPNCDSIYEIENLMSSNPIKTNENDLTPRPSAPIQENDESTVEKKWTRRFFDLVGFVMMLMVVLGSITGKDIFVALVFGPIVLLFWLVARYMLK